MTIHLPDELEASVRAAVHGGRFASVEDAMAEAVRRLLHDLDRTPQVAPAGGATGPGLGSIGFMRDAAAELDEIVADAMQKRREETWRDISLE